MPLINNCTNMYTSSISICSTIQIVSRRPTNYSLRLPKGGSKTWPLLTGGGLVVPYSWQRGSLHHRSSCGCTLLQWSKVLHHQSQTSFTQRGCYCGCQRCYGRSTLTTKDAENTSPCGQKGYTIMYFDCGTSLLRGGGGAYARDKNTSVRVCAKNAGGAYARGGGLFVGHYGICPMYPKD